MVIRPWAGAASDPDIMVPPDIRLGPPTLENDSSAAGFDRGHRAPVGSTGEDLTVGMT
jgi:hypothetical protein